MRLNVFICVEPFDSVVFINFLFVSFVHISYLTFRSKICLELIFIHRARGEGSFFSFIWISTCLSIIFGKDYPFFIYCSGTIVVSDDSICVGFVSEISRLFFLSTCLSLWQLHSVFITLDFKNLLVSVSINPQIYSSSRLFLLFSALGLSIWAY